MVCIRPFKAVRPKAEKAALVASYPYDVISSEEARLLAQDNPLSFLHVVKPEIDLPPDTHLYSDIVYDTALQNFRTMLQNQTLIQDTEPKLYIYKQKMGSHEQYGIVGCASADEYDKDIIKKHELTRKAKEDDRTKHVLAINANAGPVFLTYRDHQGINSTIQQYVSKHRPVVDFIAHDNIGHTVWDIDDLEIQKSIINYFNEIDYLYVADGHHRSASAARARNEKRKHDKNPSPEKEYNYFLAVYFPASQLKILDYNRIIFSIGNLTKEKFIEAVSEKFTVTQTKTVATLKHSKQFGMYFNHTWYLLEAKEGTYPDDDPVARLDVSILQKNLLAPILNIGDPRTDNNIDFIGGIRGVSELVRRVDSGECQVAFQLYPTSINDLINVADANQVMPPKSTWFEPKLRSGLLVHMLD